MNARQVGWQTTREPRNIEDMVIQTRKPFEVKDRSEWNSNIYLLEKRRKHKKYKPISTYLKIPFPVHRINDYVQMHENGFRNRKNIDLFKHYYRMYLKNKWMMAVIKKEKQQRKVNYRQIGERRNSTIISQEDANYISSNYAVLASHQRDELTEDIQDQDQPISIPLKNFIIQKNMDDLELYRNILELYDKKTDVLKKLESSNKNQQQREYKASLTYKYFELNHKFDDMQISQLFNLQEVFMERVIEIVCQRGLGALSQFDYLTFKSIVEERLDGLQDTNRFEDLLKIKSNLSRLSLEERKRGELNQLIGWVKQKQPLSNLNTQRLQQDNMSTLRTTNPNDMLNKFSQYSPQSTYFGPKNNKQPNYSDVVQLAKNVGMHDKLMNEIQQQIRKPSVDGAVKLQQMIDSIMLEQQLRNDIPEDIQEEIINTQPEEQQSINQIIDEIEKNKSDPIDLKQLSNLTQLANTYPDDPPSIVTLRKQSASIKKEVPPIILTNQNHSVQQGQASKRSSVHSVPSQPSQPSQKQKTNSIESTPKHTYNKSGEQSFNLNAQKINIQKQQNQFQDSDDQLSFLEDMLASHKQANKQLFSKIQNGEIIEEEQVINSPEENIVQFFRAERMLQHRFKKSLHTKADYYVDNEEAKKERRLMGQSRYEKQGANQIIQRAEVQPSIRSSIQFQLPDDFYEAIDKIEPKVVQQTSHSLPRLTQRASQKVQPQPDEYGLERPESLVRVQQQRDKQKIEKKQQSIIGDKQKISIVESNKIINQQNQQKHKTQYSVQSKDLPKIEKQDIKASSIDNKEPQQQDSAKTVVQHNIRTSNQSINLMHSSETFNKSSNSNQQADSTIRSPPQISPLRQIEKMNEFNLKKDNSPSLFKQQSQRVKKQKIKTSNRVIFRRQAEDELSSESFSSSVDSGQSGSRVHELQQDSSSQQNDISKKHIPNKKKTSSRKVEIDQIHGSTAQINKKISTKNDSEFISKMMEQLEITSDPESSSPLQNPKKINKVQTKKKEKIKQSSNVSIQELDMSNEVNQNKQIQGGGNHAKKRKTIIKLISEQKKRIPVKQDKKETLIKIQQQQAKLQIQQFQEELKSMLNQEHNLTDMKAKMEHLINHLTELDLIDEEIAYNILICKQLNNKYIVRQRQMQLEQISQQPQIVKESLFLGDDCDSILGNIFKSSVKIKDDEKGLKFMANIGHDNDYFHGYRQDNNEYGLNAFGVNTYGDKRISLANDLDRRKLFLFQSNCLKELALLEKQNDSIIIQTDLDKDVQDTFHNSKFPTVQQLDSDRMVRSTCFKNNCHIPGVIQKKLSKQALRQLKDKLKGKNKMEAQGDEYCFLKNYKPSLLNFDKKQIFNLTVYQQAERLFGKHS